MKYLLFREVLLKSQDQSKTKQKKIKLNQHIRPGQIFARLVRTKNIFFAFL